MSGGGVTTEVRGHVGWVTIDRPDRMNALAKATFAALVDASLELDANPEVRVVVYTGAGERAFSAGVDLKELDASGPMIHPMGGAGRNPNEVILELGKPTIAAINGVAAGGAASSRWRAISGWRHPPRGWACPRRAPGWGRTSAASCCPS